MITKKYVITFAVFGVMFFSAQATNLVNLNDQQAPQIEKWKIKIPTHG